MREGERMFTVGEVETKEVFLRVPTAHEKKRYGPNSVRVLSECPGCSGKCIQVVEAVVGGATVSSRSPSIALHFKDTPQGRVECSYGGEALSVIPPSKWKWKWR